MPKTKEQWILWGFVLVLIGLVAAGIFLTLQEEWIWGAVCLILPAFFFLGGLKTVSPEERWVIELLGSFHTIRKPGLVWVCPFLMKVRAIVGIWLQTVKLFEESVKIDFKDGSAAPRGVEVFLRIKKPDTPYGEELDKENHTGVYRAVYNVKNWRTEVRDLVENVIRSYLNGLTIDEGITQKKAGFDLLNNFPKEEREAIDNTLDFWGLEVRRVTVTDFDLEESLVRARGAVHERERRAAAADFERLAMARETMGALVEMMAESRGKTYKEMQVIIEKDKRLRKELLGVAKEIITRKMSIDGKSLIDVRTEGGGDFMRSLLSLVVAAKAAPGTKSGSSPKEGKETEKEETED